ncbi:hypothetical protein V6N11_022058 [Hibiscus sabdariffa]|uniref:Uncharacterized protein n=1 Tax=Hibiscus sabdariffa TaxID=183260 RepID=A0ABR2TI10_9ROSI
MVRSADVVAPEATRVLGSLESQAGEVKGLDFSQFPSLDESLQIVKDENVVGSSCETPVWNLLDTSLEFFPPVTKDGQLMVQLSRAILEKRAVESVSVGEVVGIQQVVDNQQVMESVSVGEVVGIQQVVDNVFVSCSASAPVIPKFQGLDDVVVCGDTTGGVVISDSHGQGDAPQDVVEGIPCPNDELFSPNKFEALCSVDIEHVVPVPSPRKEMVVAAGVFDHLNQLKPKGKGGGPKNQKKQGKGKKGGHSPSL